MNICLRMPNIDTIVFYIIFVILVPYLLIATGSAASLQYYLPALVMMSVTLTEAGAPKLFSNLYQDNPTTMSGWLSKNFINLLAIVGLMSAVIMMAMDTGNFGQTLAAGVIAFTITFPIAQSILPYFIRQGDLVLRKNTTFRFPGNWHKYFFGASFIIFLWGLQYVSLIAVNGYLASSGSK